MNILIYTPLEEEYQSLQSSFPPKGDIEGTHYTGYLAGSDSSVKIYVVVGFEWGNDAAFSAVSEALNNLDINLAFGVGIAGAISKDANLGDVYYSKQIFNLTQRNKLEKDGNGNTRTKYDTEVYNCTEFIHKELDRSRLSVSGESNYKKWINACALRNEGSIIGTDIPPSEVKNPKGLSAQIAATNAVLADTEAVSDVRACGRKISCVDTESAGFAKACIEFGSVDYLVIRGISDFANETKVQTEGEFKNVYRKIAADNAAQFLKQNLSTIIDVKKKLTEKDSPTNKEPTEVDFIDQNENKIVLELESRSIIFKTLKDRSKIPVPRLRESHIEGKKNRAKPEEIEDVLPLSEYILIKIPDHYPDTALPWLFANCLSEANIDDIYTVPILIPWSEFGPPKNSLSAHLENQNLLFAKNSNNYKIVFIIYNVDVRSKSKADFLKREAEEIKNAHYILLYSDRSKDTLTSNQISTALQPRHYEIHGISFSSITSFCQNQFEMSALESEVVAKRLIETFSNYRLDVNPTYLASIQKDTILAFIEANQRGELIELAVAGILTLVVSDDKSNVVLRRSTRERFLANLSVEIYANKNSFTRENFVSYVDEFAKEMGFEINSNQFIKSFEIGGVINFDSGYVDISIPVIKTYMLAKGLVEQKDIAKSYFDFSDDQFDYNTFDLYSEFSGDHKIYDRLLTCLEESIRFFDQKADKAELRVEEGAFKSKLFDTTFSTSEVAEQVASRANELVKVSSFVDEKQAKLDIRSSLSESASERTRKVRGEDFKDEYVGLTRFIAASIMLGAAAERMNDEFKLELVQKLLKLGERIISDLLSMYAMLDFEEIATDAAEHILEEDKITFETDEARIEFLSLVELMVSQFEFFIASRPIHGILNILAETARTNVLLSQLDRVKAPTKLEEFVRSTWSFDMSPYDQRRTPKTLSKRLGKDPFLRLIYGEFMNERLYWYHSDKKSQDSIVDGIDEVLSQINLRSTKDS